MATKKDLVEAHSFSRRRLVTAFVSGAPGGREVEPSRPGRTVIGGLALAVLLVAGAAIASSLSPRAATDWEKGGMAISEKGSLYVVLESEPGVVRPVLNVTSAQLILGSDIEPTSVKEKEIATYPPGEALGILGAPTTVPSEDRLLQSGWTACTLDRALRVDVSEETHVRVDESAGMLVRSQGRYYVIGQAPRDEDVDGRAYVYPLPQADSNDSLLSAVGLPITDEAVEVPEEWLTLFPTGGSLSWESFGITRYGRSFTGPGSEELPGDARIGDYYEDGETTLLLTPDGPVQLTDFARAVYLNIERPSPYQPQLLTPDVAPQLPQTTPAYEAGHWPTGALAPVVGEHCAVLRAEPGEAPVVRIGRDPVADASVEEAGLEPRDRDQGVDNGHGAYVLSGGWDARTFGSPYFLDSTTQAHPLLGSDVPDRLGYGDVEPPVVPDSWVELFESGAALSVNAALCPPQAAGAKRPCE